MEIKMKKQKRRQGKSRLLTKDEIKRVIQFQESGRHSVRNVCLVHLSCLTGMRVGEISKLKLKDVVNDSWVIKDEMVIPKEYTKTNKTRVVYLVHKELRSSLEKLIQERRKTIILNETRRWKEQPVFVSQKGGRFSSGSLQRTYKNMYMSVGLGEMVSSHSGRRTFITNLISSGIDMKTVSTLSGHSSIQTTLDVYSVPNPIKMENVCRNLTIQ
tara:strand:+ start:63 stop:704 length:642 start_codon:yes stop_codon:yes gene_type:complete